MTERWGDETKITNNFYMILITDSGSTKADWVLVNGDNKPENFSTIGFNPFFHDEKFIVDELLRQNIFVHLSDKIDKIFFYGAGCSSPERNEIVKSGLQKTFPNAEILVDHDLLASAYSVYTGEPCIAGILGTGSNSCFFDGKKVREEIPALAYILGDEGSGSYYGKMLLKKFLYKQLPEKIHDTLKNEYKLDKEVIFDNVYCKPNANVYLASFFRVMVKHKDEEFVRKAVELGMADFMENHIYCFPNYKEVKTNFVGSVGFYFEDILREVAAKMGIDIGKVIKQPINGLVDFHLNYIL